MQRPLILILWLAALTLFTVLARDAAATASRPAAAKPLLYIGAQTAPRVAELCKFVPNLAKYFDEVTTWFYDPHAAEPLRAACKEAGIRFVPGLSVGNYVVGLTPRYRANGQRPDEFGGHKYTAWADIWTPAVLLDHRLWDQLYDDLMSMNGHGAVMLDFESVFWMTRDDAFWTPANMAAIKAHMAYLVARLKAAGLTLYVFHPQPTNTPKIAQMLDLAIPKRGLVHLCSRTYREKAATFTAAANQAEAAYRAAGIPIKDVRLGTIFPERSIADMQAVTYPAGFGPAWLLCDIGDCTNLLAQLEAPK